MSRPPFRWNDYGSTPRTRLEDRGRRMSRKARQVASEDRCRCGHARAWHPDGHYCDFPECHCARYDSRPSTPGAAP